MRRAFRPAFAADAGEPIAALNITPLIDVMLVLLVMFILVLPALTHEVPLDLPKPAPSRALPVVTTGWCWRGTAGWRSTGWRSGRRR